jgi:hypothetical protein
MLIIFGETIFDADVHAARLHLIKQTSDDGVLYGVYLATKEVGWWRLQSYSDQYTALLQYKKVSDTLSGGLVFALNTEKTQTVKSMFQLGIVDAKVASVLTYEGAEWYPSGASFVGKRPENPAPADPQATVNQDVRKE